MCEKEIEGNVFFKPFARLNYDLCSGCYTTSEPAIRIEKLKEGVMLE